MFISEKNLCNIDNDNVNIFIIENDIKDVINKFFLLRASFTV